MKKSIIKFKFEHSNLFELFIPIYLIINQYYIFGQVTLGFVCIVIITIVELFKTQELKIYKPLLLTISLFLLHDIIKIFFVDININLWLQRIVFILFIFISARKVDENHLYKVWSYVGFAIMLGLLYQSYFVYFRHEPVQIIKIFPLPTDVAEETSYLRPHSFFCEPAVCAIWLIPLLFMSLKRRKIFFSSIITLEILLTTSSTGIIICGVLWLYYVIRKENYSKKNRVAIIIILIIIISLFFSVDLFKSALQKIMNIRSDSSSFVRLFFGFLLFINCKMMWKLFGIPFASVAEYLLSDNVSLAMFNITETSKAFGYVNSLSQSLLLYGIIGTFFYIMLYYYVWKNAVSENKIFVFICFLSIFGQSVFFNAIFIMQFVFILSLDHSNNYMRIKL